MLRYSASRFHLGHHHQNASIRCVDQHSSVNYQPDIALFYGDASPITWSTRFQVGRHTKISNQYFVESKILFRSNICFTRLGDCHPFSLRVPVTDNCPIPIYLASYKSSSGMILLPALTMEFSEIGFRSLSGSIIMITELRSSQLRRIYQEKDVCGISQMVPRHKKAIIGQHRAVRALKFGLGNRAPGFNVYVSAPHGEEKIEVIRHFLKELAEKDPLPFDWCYVNNFKDNYCPIVLQLPQGRAIEFKSDVETFILEARDALIKTLESEEFGREQDDIKQELAQKQQKIFNEIQEEANKIDFLVKSTPMEIVAIPRVGDKPMSQEHFKALKKEEREDIQAKQSSFQKLLESTLRKTRDLEKKVREKLLELERKAALFAIDDLLKEILSKYDGIKGVTSYMDDMRQHILNNLSSFLKNNRNRKGYDTSAQPTDVDRLYQVNILVDNHTLTHSPIRVELNPTYNNLFGKIERESVMGTLVTDFTLIRPGALHHANGGYLILPVEDLLRVPFSYDQLKRSLRNKRIDIEDPTERYGFISTKSLKPEAVPLDLQVILIGRNYLMQLLYMYDDDFRDLFKVKAEFDSIMPANESNVKELCGFIHAFCEEESLLQPSDAAL
ncbi:MAG: AAA family ATPase, partial [Saprospiraceae bacterium]|nr:AAA family ATPase [Saprospiraceae bacterium]